MTMSDRIAVYCDGRIRQCGTPEDVYARPSCVFVAEFLGESNILRGEQAATATFTTSAGQVIPVPARTATDIAFTAGERAAVLIRPESVRVESTSPWSGSATDDGVTRLEGQVRELAYLGADQRRVVDTAVGAVVSRSPAGNGASLDVGDEVTVSWPTSACTVLRDE
jgi:ABC-type Fe3+/spermidine/putrescine transport system ATPase subunit